MLKLVDIVKEYPTGDTSVTALKGVSVEFRKSEFVSILGHSGCGKTTLLNIIGGLDQYTSGDLIISGKSTKDFNDRDWDNYRNHSVGFIFQSYNLIPHQSVLSNVELALTLSGVSKEERKKRAKEALEKVGLGDQLNKRPNQLSGGQMQRVAIARALVNDPEILLADEPTGALDSDTSIQIMDILREVSADRLVIMVTHNPDLANEYSTRIIRLVDGNITADSMPYSESEDETAQEETVTKEKKSGKESKPSMSFLTALSLSLNNLMTKKARTFLTSFAGSIGIIGIALILALSNGFQAYIDSIQQEALTSYPITVDTNTMDLNSLLTSFSGMTPGSTGEVDHALDKVYSNTLSASMMESLSSEVWTNDLESFKKFLTDNKAQIDQYVSSIQYKYAGDMNIYYSDTSEGLNQVYPSPIIDLMNSMMGSFDFGGYNIDSTTMETYQSYYNSWLELVDNEELLRNQYDLVKGSWPSKYNEVVLVVDKNNEISDLAIQGLGIMTATELTSSFMSVASGEEAEVKKYEIDYDEIIGRKFKLVLEPDYYSYNKETSQWEDMHGDDYYVQSVIEKAEDITIVGIIRPSDDSIMVVTTGSVGYTTDLTQYVVEATNKREIVKQQKAHPDIDVFTGLPFVTEEIAKEEKADTKAAKTEEKTAAAEAKNTDVFETPSAGFAYKSDEEAKAGFTAQQFDLSSLPPATEEDVYAAIDANYSGEEAERYKRTVELLLKPIRSSSERAELIANLNDMLAGYEIEGMGTMSGEQALNMFSMLDNSTKLKVLYAIASGQFDDMATPEGEAETPAEPEKEEGKDKAENDEKTPDTDKTEEETQPEEEPEEEVPQPLAANYAQALSMLGAGDINVPTQINIYPKDFEAKDEISKLIEEYNKEHEGAEIKYTDYIGLLLTSVTKIINIISYVLIAFVAISLVVSSIMIGIITYISVLERTKEIGILRAIGASKRDISRVFNAETFIVGLVSGAIGIGATLLLCIPINMVIKYVTTIPHVAQLPFNGAIILIIISIVLTLVAGLIPAKIASKKDPVIALRTE